MLRPIYENIPDEIKVLPQWVLWREEPRKDDPSKMTKPPFQPNGLLAESNNPATWHAFDKVKAVVDRFDGLGFVPSQDDLFVGLDFDNCRCPAFDGVAPWANSLDVVLSTIADHIRKLNSYTERSPSGKGIRVWLKGKLPLAGKKKGDFEVYQARHYLTITGHILDGFPLTIEPRQEDLDEFYQAVFLDHAEKAPEAYRKPQIDTPPDGWRKRLEKAFQGKNGTEIKQLWDGDFADYTSQSEADLALCSHLAFWLDGDAAAMNAAFRESGLYREKWDEKHYSDGRTYGDATIEQALNGCQSFYGNHSQKGGRYETAPLETWPKPVPLPDGLPPVKPLDPVLIPAPLRGWLMDIADRMQIPPDFSTAAAVVALGSIIGRGCGIYPKRHDDWLVVPNLWGAVVGRPSLMKTPAISDAQRHLNRLEAEARDEYEKATDAFENDREVMKITRAAIGEEIKKAVKQGKEIEEARDKLAALQVDEPTRRRYQTQDSTTEKIGELLNQNPRGLLINRDELIGWFRSLDRDGRESDRAFYLEAWNGNRGFIYDRIGRGTLDISALCVSIFGAITPGQLSSYVYQANRCGNGDDGLLQRFQVFVWPDAPAEWKNVDRFPDTTEKNRAWEIFKALSGDIPGTVKEKEADIPALRFSLGGQDVFDTWRYDLETRLRSDDSLHPAMESHLTKYRKLMPSLALIFHLVSVADGSASGSVCETAAIMAAAWCDYLESHACRIYGAATMPGMEAAREIIKHIRRGAIQDGCNPKDIYRNHWSRLATPEEVKAGLEVLEECEWLIVKKITTGGRPSEIITLNPQAKL